VNRPYIVGVIVGMLNASLGAHMYNIGMLSNWWNMLLLCIAVNVAVIIGARIASHVAEKAQQELDEHPSNDG